MAIFVVYADDYDAVSSVSAVSYEAARENSASGASLSSKPSATISLTYIFTGSFWIVSEFLLRFDTSVIDSSVVSDAVLYAYSVDIPAASFACEVRSYTYTPPATTADYVKGSLLSTYTLAASVNFFASIAGQYTKFLDSNLKSAINTSGHTGLHFSVANSRLDIAPTDSTQSCNIGSTDEVGTDQDPKMIITAEFPPSALGGGPLSGFSKMLPPSRLVSP